MSENTSRDGGAPTAAMLSAVFARTDAQLLAEHEAKQRAERWPREITETVAALTSQVEALTARVAELEAAQG